MTVLEFMYEIWKADPFSIWKIGIICLVIGFGLSKKKQIASRVIRSDKYIVRIKVREA